MNKWRDAIAGGGFLRVGHRGAAGLAPMNTLRSFQTAIAAGVDAVELDVRWSADRQLVVIHDEELAGSTNGQGLVHDFTLAELRTLDAGQGERIPTLDEALDLLKGKALVVIDLKLVGYEAQIGRTVLAHAMEHDTLICSTLPENLPPTRASAPGAFVCFSYPQDTTGLGSNPRLRHVVNVTLAWMRATLPWRIGAMLDAVGADGTMLYHRLATPAVAEAVHRRGKFIGAWTVDTPEDIARVRATGVDSITSNRPDLLTQFSAAANRRGWPAGGV